ncbi:unnamed protein product [Phytophthora lilii]|uniref:Unnamed protein product n=1 Tax=Phytophthora lilii TaxID=2077276 RepID=A0A9W6XII1_9STRA|nr:unnamed protein product [Phytophthora lilii]
MNISTLRAPNSNLLSDDLVAGAVQCRRKANHLLAVSVQHDPCSLLSPPANPSMWFEQKKLAKTIVSGANSAAHAKRNRHETANYPEAKRLQLVASDGRMVQTVTNATLSDGQKDSMAELVTIGWTICLKQDAMVVLEEKIQMLRMEIVALKADRCRAAAAYPSITKAVAAYFQQLLQWTRNHSQLEFIRTTMAPDVVFNSDYGLQAIVTSWYCLHWFDNVQVELQQSQRTKETSIIVKTKTSLTISKRTLTNIFPHLCSNSNKNGGEDYNNLVGKLLSQRIVLYGSTQFEWGSASSRVKSVLFQSDMLTPMLKLLGSLETVADAFEGALISLVFNSVS